MKKKLCIPLAILAIVAMATAFGFAPAGGQSPSKAKPIKLAFSGAFPSVHGESKLLEEQWCKEIEKRTNGRVKITYYPVNVLTTGERVYDSVVTGVADIGNSVITVTPGRFPASEALGLPLGFPSAWVSTKVVNDFYSEFRPKEYDDVHVLHFFGNGPSYLAMASSRITKIEDLRGKIVRCSGYASKIISALGGQAPNIGMSEAYESLAKHVVDGTYNPPEVLRGWRLAEVVKYLTDTSVIGSPNIFFLVMNKEVWHSLPADIQKVVTDVSNECIEKQGKLFTAYDVVGTEYFMSLKEGREVLQLADPDKWIEAVKPVTETYIKEKGPRGLGLPTESYVDYIKSRIAYWSDKQASKAECMDFLKTLVK